MCISCFLFFINILNICKRVVYYLRIIIGIVCYVLEGYCYFVIMMESGLYIIINLYYVLFFFY